MSLFKEKPILFEIMYHRGGDYAGAFYLKNVVDNLSYLEETLGSFDYSINSIENILDFLWLLDFKEMASELEIFKIDEDTKLRINKLADLINTNPKEFINFVNSNTELVFTKSKINKPMYWHIYLPRMLNICFNNYSSSLKQNVFDFIEENLYLNVLSSFCEYQKYYLKHKESFKKLFMQLKDTAPFDDKVYKDFLLKKNDIIDAEFLKEQATFICERAYNEIVNMGLDADNNEIMQAIHLFDEYYELARFYKLKCANKFNAYKPKIEKALNIHILKYGQHMDFGPIDLKPVLDIFEKSDDVYRFFQLTHFLKNNKYYNNFNQIFETTPPDGLSGLFPPRGKVSSDNYPIYRQEQIELHLSINASILNMIIVHPKLSIDFSNYLMTICSHVELNYFNECINIFNEIGGSYEMISNLYMLKTKNQSDSLLYKALCNGCCVNLCGTIEKILRNVIVKEESDNIYIDESNLTLGQIFSRIYNLSSISDGIKYYLKYILLTDEEASPIKEKRPGKNIRNWQMHNSNDKYDKTNYQLCVELLYLTISLVTDLVVVSLKTDEK